MHSLTYNMAENSWHIYDMKKLSHCHPMYIRDETFEYVYLSFVIYILKAIYGRPA